LELFAPTGIKSVWMVSFEYSGVASLGGLGEAVRARAEMLARRAVSVTVFMPSHGRCWDPLLRVKLGLRDTGFSECSYRRGVDGRYYHYCIGADEANVKGVRVVLFKGLDRVTRGVLDEWSIYSRVEEKASLLARALKAYTQRSGELPDLVEVHDWHSVLAGVIVRQEAEKRGLAVPLVYTIHLSGSPSFPWHYASQDWSGLQDGPHLVWRIVRHEVEHYSSLWDSLGGNVEAFGVHEADLVVTVSLSYLREELFKRYGDWIAGKSCVIYNPVDLRIEDAERWVVERYGGLGGGVEWRIVEDTLSGYRRWGYLDRGGALLISLGRLTWQKGFDVAVRALDHTPSSRLLILGLQVGDYGFESELRRLVEERAGRVMVVLDRIPVDVRDALIRLATATVVPSRWEPFGLVAVESMALGTPVIASAVGGLREVVVDLRSNPNGTGLLVRPEDPADMGVAMESLVQLMSGGSPHLIPIQGLRSLASPDAGLRVRGNCVKHVDEHFREHAVYSQVEACYERARQMAYYRAVASAHMRVG
jgi:starch synthase